MGGVEDLDMFGRAHELTLHLVEPFLCLINCF